MSEPAAVIGLMIVAFGIGLVTGLIMGLTASTHNEARRTKKAKRSDAAYYTVDGEAVSEAYAKSVWDERQGNYVIPPTAPHQF